MTKCYLAYSMYGGGGEIDYFECVFTNELDADEWVKRMEKEKPQLHHYTMELDLITKLIKGDAN